MRIMLDTNVLISMFLFPSVKMNELKTILCEHHHIFLCTYVVDELKDVINRKFPSKKYELEQFLSFFPFTLLYTPEYINRAEYPSMRDDFDIPVLASAILEDVDLLISGDKDFSSVDVEKPEILTPSEFLNIYSTGKSQ